MITDYPSFEAIQGDPQYWLHGEPPITYFLLIGVSAWGGLESYGWVKTGEKAQTEPSPTPKRIVAWPRKRAGRRIA